MDESLLSKAGVGVEFDVSSGKLQLRNTIPTSVTSAAGGGGSPRTQQQSQQPQTCLNRLSTAADTKQSSRDSRVRQQGNISTAAVTPELREAMLIEQKDEDTLEFM